MRVASDTRLLEVDPGSTAAVVVEIVNNQEVIDGVTARVIGIPDELVSVQPALLPLFPDATGQVTLSLAVPPSIPAGRHPLTVEVVSHGARQPSQFLDVDLDVTAKPALEIGARPKVIRARRNARFVLELTNRGNVPLDVTLIASDVDRSTRVAFTPDRVRVEPNTIVPVLLAIRGPRMFTGAEADRAVTIDAQARSIQYEYAPEMEPEALLSRSTTITFRQKPFISRGLLTCLILLSIIALWAGVFLLGIGKVFAGDPMTKDAPASFFASLPASSSKAGGAGGAAGGGAGGASGNGAGGAGAAPAGALPKNGQVPAGTGGSIIGKVTAANDQQPVGRILVQAWRMSRNGLVEVGSAATQADGTYAIAGLFPTSYYVKFSANGYVTQWYPSVPTQVAGQQVSVSAQGSTNGVNAIIVGNPASIAGKVDPGDALSPVSTTVTARPLLGTQAGKAIAVTTTNAAGSYSIANLPAPGTYQLTFTTPGYQPSSIVDTVGGGDQRLEPTVRLGASTGQISGTVRDGATALGGVTVSTTLAGKPLTVVTPTTGQVGAFVLGNLTTPATYVVTFSAQGHGSTTTIVDLAAGQSRLGLDINLTGGSGTVTGKVFPPTGSTGLGGVTVSVGGAAAVPGTAGTISTTTLTAGDIGSFAINGLAVPGAYTLTFTAPGYASASVPVTLSDTGPAPTISVRLANQLGSITGHIFIGPSGSTIFPGATITATNDRQSWTATSNSSDGSYLITGLQPGSYSVTVTAAGHSQMTALDTVVAGATSHQDLRVDG